MVRLAHGHDCVVHDAAARLGLPVHLTPRLDRDRDALQGNLLLTALPGPSVRPVTRGESVIDAKRAVAQRLPGRIYVASQVSPEAGLTVGARALGATTRVIGVNPMTDAQEAYLAPEAILAVARDAAECLELDLPLSTADVENTTAYVGDGYGIPSDGAIEAIRLAARTESLILDPVYSGKAFVGLIDAYRTGAVGPAVQDIVAPDPYSSHPEGRRS